MKTLFLSALALVATAGYSQSLRITVKEVEDKPSNILLAVMDESGKILKYGMEKAQGDTALFTLDSLPPGRAKVYVFQDENGNYRLDTDGNNVPVEKCALVPVDLLAGENTTEAVLKYPSEKEQ